MAMNSLDLLGSVNQRNTDTLNQRKNDSKDKSLFDSILNEASKETKKSDRQDRTERKESKSDSKDNVSKKDDNNNDKKVEDKSQEKTKEVKQNDEKSNSDVKEISLSSDSTKNTLNQYNKDVELNEENINTKLPNNSTLDIINLKAQTPSEQIDLSKQLLDQANSLNSNQIQPNLKNDNTLKTTMAEQLVQNIEPQKNNENSSLIKLQENAVDELIVNKQNLNQISIQSSIENSINNSAIQENIIQNNLVESSTLMDKILKQANESLTSQNKLNDTNLNIQNKDNNLNNLDLDLPQDIEVNNKKLANDLAKISKSTNNIEENKNLQNSLLDRLSQSSQKIDQIQNEKAISAVATNQTNTESVISSQDDVISNIFLGSQNNSVQNAQIIQKETGLQLAKNANSLEDVKKSAKILDLNLQDAKVEIEDSSNEKSNTIDIIGKAAFTQTIMKKDLLEATDSFNDAKLLHSQVSSSAAYFENDEPIDIEKLPATNLNLSQSAAYTLENRIIGAKQELRSTMNDVAKAMWENYRPPVTAFRLNIQPANLGTISIVMRNDSKENTIKISMSMNNSSTLDAFIENETELSDAIKQNFDNGTNLAFDFNMFGDGNNNSDSESFVVSSESINKDEVNDNSIRVDDTKKSDNTIYM